MLISVPSRRSLPLKIYASSENVESVLYLLESADFTPDRAKLPMEGRGMDRVQARSCRRVMPERRIFSWRTVLFGFLRSRRLASRRESNAIDLFLDWHHPWLFFIALGIMVLSCVDAVFTLRLISHGMIEANPVMAAAMSQGTAIFISAKVAMTGVAILILVYFSNVNLLNLLRTGLLLTLFFCFYCCLICYEFVALMGMT